MGKADRFIATTSKSGGRATIVVQDSVVRVGWSRAGAKVELAVANMPYGFCGRKSP